MAAETLPRRPAEEPEVLRRQLLEALSRLEAGEASDSMLWRAYLRQMLALTWERFAQGSLSAPHEALRILEDTRAFVERNLPPEEDPKAIAARELEVSWGQLESMSRAAEAAHIEAKLKKMSSTTERVLRVLYEANGRLLRRAEILDAMSPEVPGPKQRPGSSKAVTGKPTPSRISQVLEELYSRGFVRRRLGRARGGSEVGFYALSPAGMEFCSGHLKRNTQNLASGVAQLKSPPSELSSPEMGPPPISPEALQAVLDIRRSPWVDMFVSRCSEALEPLRVMNSLRKLEQTVTGGSSPYWPIQHLLPATTTQEPREAPSTRDLRLGIDVPPGGRGSRTR